MIGDAIALLGLLRKFDDNRRVLSALFSPDGTRLQGDDRIKVVIHDSRHPEHPEKLVGRFYSIEPITGYEFVRMPVNPGAVIESIGCITATDTFDADFFRYIPVPDGLPRFGGIVPNVMIRFMVYGYRIEDLLSLGKGNIG
jgi:hypothetical protein